jgi:hypothetical protein
MFAAENLLNGLFLALVPHDHRQSKGVVRQVQK